MLGLILFLLTTNLFLEIAFADSNPPKFVGLRENQQLIWRTEFDNDPFEAYLEDLGYNESDIENYIDYVFDGMYDTDVKGWRIYILKIYEEKENDYKGETVDYVEILLNRYWTEKWDSWHSEEKNEIDTFAEYNKDMYLNAMARGSGLLELWIPKNMDWSELVDGFEEELEDDNEDGSAKVETTSFFFQNQKCGISTKFEEVKDKEFESISRYTQDGILLYYEWSYDSDAIMRIDLENAYFIENWWWLSLILAFSLLGIIFVTVVIIKKRRQKKENSVPI